MLTSLQLWMPITPMCLKTITYPISGHAQIWFIKENYGSKTEHKAFPTTETPWVDVSTLGSTIFDTSEDDNKIGLSVEDKLFLEVMKREMLIDDSNSWMAPIVFKGPPSSFPTIATRRSNAYPLFIAPTAPCWTGSSTWSGQGVLVLIYLWGVPSTEAGSDQSCVRLKCKVPWRLFQWCPLLWTWPQ